MSTEPLHHPAVKLLCGQGLDLPRQAARARSCWLPGREGRTPVLLVLLLVFFREAALDEQEVSLDFDTPDGS